MPRVVVCKKGFPDFEQIREALGVVGFRQQIVGERCTLPAVGRPRRAQLLIGLAFGVGIGLHVRQQRRRTDAAPGDPFRRVAHAWMAATLRGAMAVLANQGAQAVEIDDILGEVIALVGLQGHG